MDFLRFEKVSFRYPSLEGDLDENGNQIEGAQIFSEFSASFPAGFISLVGPNGSGKSTFMLLASGRIIPNSGGVLLFEKNPAKLAEQEKNLLASVIYQNMEFETDEKINALLDFVFQNGTLRGKGKQFSDCIKIFELEEILEKSILKISKGELQRVLLAFSILYGSPAIFMDEPLFAMEFSQKERALKFLRDYSENTGTAICISMHELELTRRFAKKVLLFYPDRKMDFGDIDEVLTRDALEKAYSVPESMLKQSESLTRENLAALFCR